MTVSRVTLMFALLVASTVGAQSFVNWENPHVHPLERSGDLLLAVNTADNRVELFDVASGTAVHVESIPVGLDPVSVRVIGDQAWVANHISDSVSVVDLVSRSVIATLKTGDEPADIVFAGTPTRAFVSCSQVNQVWVFDVSDLTVPPQIVDIFGEDPRALAVSNDGSTVYAAVFESGNKTTVLGGGLEDLSTLAFPPNVVSSALGPYGGMNPPPNMGIDFEPAINLSNPTAPAVALIVRQDTNGDWKDDNDGDWTDLVTGPSASESGRPEGWHLVDHDVAVIAADTLDLSYVTGLMNICMAIGVHPTSGMLSVVGTEATNEIRFEPNLTGKFVRVNAAFADPTGVTATSIVDLNDHLDYTVGTVPQTERDKSIGDPRAIAWQSDGSRAFVAGMGSNNLAVIDATGARVGAAPTIEVGQGPTGLALDEARDRLYVLNKFDASISVVDLVSELQVDTVPFYDPTPAAIKTGRFALYDTHRTSGLGQTSCGSCHVDSRMDRLGWDLGDPSGDMAPMNQNCLDILGVAGCEDWHPMKGPMTTQTLQDIIGMEPHHWRGDREGIEAFNPAFEGLLGDDEQLTDDEMQEFEDFLATIYYPPNPFRNLNNSLPNSLPLPGHFTTGRFAPAGAPMPNGNAISGLSTYRNSNLDNPFDCVSCHTLPTGAGPDLELVGFSLQPIPPGPDGERHLMVVGVDGSTNVTIKIPQLRNDYEKTGFNTTQLANTQGFGYLHDGSVDSLERFLTEPAFSVVSDQQVANIVAFMLAFSGSDLPQGSMTTIFEPLGPLSHDTHAAVGQQLSFDGTTQSDPTVLAMIDEFSQLAESNDVGLVANGLRLGEARGYRYEGGDVWQSDRASETVTTAQMRNGTLSGGTMTLTVVPLGSQTRIGIDRDEDGFFDRDEIDGCSNPADPSETPPGPACGTFVRGDCNDDGGVDISDPIAQLDGLFSGGAQPGCADACDSNDDGSENIADVVFILDHLFGAGTTPAAPFPGCGIDPTVDPLGCSTFTSCP